MDRRRFLQMIAGASTAVATAFEIDYEKILWVPGERTHFIIHKPAPVRFANNAEIKFAIEKICPPRYTITVGSGYDFMTDRRFGPAQYVYDENWRLMNGDTLIRQRYMTPEQVADLTRVMGVKDTYQEALKRIDATGRDIPAAEYWHKRRLT